MVNTISSFQSFLNSALLYDQTQLVNMILENDHQKKFYSEMHNRKEYKIFLSDSELVGSKAVIQEKHNELSKELACMNMQLAEANSDETTLKTRRLQIEKDLEILDSAQSRNKYVYEWLLVPDWLAEELISIGEVVFRGLGCCFWGVAHFCGNFNTKESTLQDIFVELSL